MGNPINQLPSFTPTFPPPLSEGTEVNGTTPIELPELALLSKSMKQSYETYMRNFDPNNASTPGLPTPTLEDDVCNEWLQNGGLVEVIVAKLKTAIADTQARLAAGKMISAFIQDIFEQCLAKIASMKLEADKIEKKGNLDAEQTMNQAIGSFASAAVSGLACIGSSCMYYRAGKAADKEFFNNSKPAVGMAGGSSKPDSDNLNLRINRVDSRSQNSSTPLTSDSSKARRESDTKSDSSKEKLEDATVEAKNLSGGKGVISPATLQKLSVYDQTMKSVLDNIVQGTIGVVNANKKKEATQEEKAIKLEQAKQVLNDAFIAVMQSTMEIIKRYYEETGNRIDQNYNLKELLQFIAVGYQKL